MLVAHFFVASNFGTPVAALCITRRLYLITTAAGSLSFTKAEVCSSPKFYHFVALIFLQKYRAVVIDLAIGLGIPLIGVVLRMSN
jgi:hypothetical protein